MVHMKVVNVEVFNWNAVDLEAVNLETVNIAMVHMEPVSQVEFNLKAIASKTERVVKYKVLGSWFRTEGVWRVELAFKFLRGAGW